MSFRLTAFVVALLAAGALVRCGHADDGAPGGEAESPAELPIVWVERDDTVVTTSCRLRFPERPILDANGDGVVRIEGEGLVVDLDGTILRGAAADAHPDAFAGTGIVVRGRGITLRNGGVRGFRCGILVVESDGATLERLDCSDNYAMRLRSGIDAEDPGDWLWPHENDDREWVTRYGAGLCVERSSDVTIREITVRRTQNGILLDRVSKSRIYDNDCSFLSGWGLALWRSSDNVICRNAFDFCIRGYSHGRYNRGQDSAGILLFEQCSKNVIAFNSATHGGDGLFGFGGKEALGERPPPEGAADGFHRRRGCNDNVIVGNDFSFAAAHGLEMTFSFGNLIAANRFEGNGICGVWGGYSRESLIVHNRFSRNGGPEGAGEGGGIDIEHGRRNRIVANEFVEERVAIELWTDEDAGLRKTPWAIANGAGSADNVIESNRFVDVGIHIILRESENDVEADNVAVTSAGEALPEVDALPDFASLKRSLPGSKDPIGGHRSLGGREAIRMTTFGPWEGRRPLFTLAKRQPHRAVWALIGGKATSVQVLGGGPLRVQLDPFRNEATVNSELPGFVLPYEIVLRHGEATETGTGCLVVADWRVTFFPSPVDPREDLELWRAGTRSADSVVIEAPAIDFAFGHDGPASLTPGGVNDDILAASHLPKDHFGTIATAKLEFPPGTFTLRVTSDDGVRVLVDGKPVIEDWSWHAPRESTATITIDRRRSVDITIEHFELDGFATLSFAIDGELEPHRRFRPRDRGSPRTDR